MIALLAAVVAGPTPAQLFERAVAAHRKLNSAVVSVESRGSALGKVSNSRFIVIYDRPSELLLNVHAEETDSQNASDRTYWIHGKRLDAIDSLAGERLSHTVVRRATLAETAEGALGQLEESVQYLLDPAALQRFVRPFEHQDGWKSERAGKGWKAVRGDKMSFEFNGRSLLTHVRMHGKGNAYLAWDFKYQGTPSKLSLDSAPDFKRVNSFVEKPVVRSEPRYMDPKAKAVWHAAVSAYGGLRHVSMTVRSSGISEKAIISGQRAFQDQPGLRWAYDGKVLVMRKAGKASKNKIQTSEIPAKVGASIDPLLQAWALHWNPARALAGKGTNVRTAGSVVLQGLPCDVLELDRPGLRLSLLVRRKDHLFARVTSRSLDAKGNVLSILDREFTYQSVNKPIPASAFRP